MSASPDNRSHAAARRPGQPLVQAAADRLRDLILAQAPGTQIGSLSEVAQTLGVGIVTVQQAARVLEHEGLLEVRRGPGGGYYGARPDDAALERSVAAYLRVHGSAYREVLEMMSLLDTELMPAAARCDDEAARSELAALLPRLGGADTPAERISFEEALRHIIFRMVDRPLFELLGNRYLSHGPGHHEGRHTIEIVAGHPVTNGVTDFELFDEYYEFELADEKVEILAQRRRADGVVIPVMYAREFGAGRVVYLALGHDMRAWGEPPFRKLVAQALAWAGEGSAGQ